jgi:hypothetical protein
MAGKAAQPEPVTETEPVVVPMMIGWPVVATCGVFTVAGIFRAADRYGGPLSPWWLGLLGAVATVVAARESRQVYSPRLFGNAQADLAVVVATAIGGATTAWWVWTGSVGVVDTWAHLLLLCLLGTTLWWGLLWNGARIERRAVPDPAAPAAVDDGDWPWESMLGKVDQGAHEIHEIESHRAGVALICHPRDDASKVPTYTTFAGYAEKFATLAALEARRRGTPLPVNAVRTNPGRDDAEYRMEITMRDVFAGQSFDFIPNLEPWDIADPLDLGELETGDRILVKALYRHAQIVGATDSGKSVLANNLIARITGCDNALVWLGATDKLMPIAFPWLRCFYEGKTSRPVLDWCAGMNVRELLMMLAAAYKLACDRNARNADESKIKPSRRYPAVFVIIEETSHSMEFGDWIRTHDGIKANVSKLIKLIVRNGRSAGVHIVLMSQTALNEAFGPDAPAIKRQLSVKFVLRTNEAYDGAKTLSGLSGSVRTDRLQNNTLLFQQVREGSDVARAIPGKAALLDGTNTISHIAERHARWRPELEAEADLGPDYAGRWAADRNVELARVVAAKGLTWREPGAPTFQVVDPLEAPPTTLDVEGALAAGQTVVWDDGTPEPASDTIDFDAVWRDIVAGYSFDGAEPSPPTPPAARRSVLGLPDPEQSKLFATLDDIAANPRPARIRDEPSLDEPIASIWAHLTGGPDLMQRFFTTAELQAVCAGYGDDVEGRIRLGRDIYTALRIQSRNPRVDERRDTRQKGYNRTELYEAITRLRHGGL